MRIVNDKNIPALLYKFLSHDNYDHAGVKGTLSATTLLKPIQEIVLTERHYDEIEVDASERLWSVLGSGVHEVLKQAKLSDEQEERLYAEVNGQKISGQYDLIDKEINDFKTTSVFTIIYKSRIKEWTEQLSIYRWLYWKNKNIVLPDKAKIIAILRDWQKSKAQTDTYGNYPQNPMVEIPIDLIPVKATEKMIEHIVESVKTARRLTDAELPECTKEERWWNEKAKKYNKCDAYCDCRLFCQQLKGEQGTKTPKIQEGKLL